MEIKGKGSVYSSVHFGVDDLSHLSVHKFSDNMLFGACSGCGDGTVSVNMFVPYDVARALAELLLAACDAHDDERQLPANAKVVTP